MKELNDNQRKAVELLELAGYRIERGEKTFSLWEGEKKLHGYSSYNFLTTDFMMRTIKELSYKRGYKKGRQMFRQEIHELLF